MKQIWVSGGGVTGTAFALLCQKAFPGAQLRVFDRVPRSSPSTGLVLNPDALALLDAVEEGLGGALEPHLIALQEIEVRRLSQRWVSPGQHLVGVSQAALLSELRKRCLAHGVRFETGDLAAESNLPSEADLVVAADGAQSALRTKFSSAFVPRVQEGKARYLWLTTHLPLRRFLFAFENSPHGPFWAHAYPFGPKETAFIVECGEEAFLSAGLHHRSAQDSVELLEQVFAETLLGHRLVPVGPWRRFATVQCEAWHHRHLVLLGDAAHTTHFSTGSGTRLALEDALALSAALQENSNFSSALEAYQTGRKARVERAQRVSRRSQAWFEEAARHLHQPLPQFAFNLLTRAHRTTYEDLKIQDPALIAEVNALFSSPEVKAPRKPPPMFSPFQLRSLTLHNRVVVSPMCQYRAENGEPNDWHLVHLGARAVGGAGLVIAEKTAVSAEGRITLGCAGIYQPEHVRAWKRIVDFVHRESSAKIGLQLGHAGRKGSCAVPWEGGAPLAQGAWATAGPSPLPFGPNWPTPKELDEGSMAKVVEQYACAARRAEEAGFDLLELHAAHGYLLSSFLCPLSNLRQDAYGGTLENRLRFPLAVFDAVRAAWPAHKPLFVRISATDWLEPEGTTLDDAVKISLAFKEHGADLIDVSTGGNVPQGRPQYGRMYQVPFAAQVRARAQVPVMAVGGIQTPDHVNTVIAAGRADLCAVGRAHLLDPHFTARAAATHAHAPAFWPEPYLAVRPTAS